MIIDTISVHLSLLSLTDCSIAILSIFKAKLFLQTFCKNSLQDDTGHIPLIHPSSDALCLLIRSLRMMISMLSLASALRKLMD